ncbi:acetylxylan esterase [Flavisolibacter ginsenosidimutans]|uniref:Acetylxylan esterase n=1 Tax=Flavisolibacter ginsenosidimutans TaxID=661481 RepID=A0A5B8UIQ3_9BACT|nr:acetylxylan esterase [Flavisolibacter ginsenosidimutans]QEC56302.1 acetylxylan esterase [Flavisolibacter ginsenosidimutans]
MTGILKAKTLCVVCLLLLWSAALFAQTPDTSVSVKLDHPEWKYNVGEKAFFSIAVQCDGKEMANTVVHVEIGPEKMQPFVSKDTLLKNGRLIINGGTLAQPGFLRCTVTAKIDGKLYKGMATAAFSPESIVATAQLPTDFAAFWKNTIEQARKISFNTRMTLLPDRSTSVLNVYEVSIQSYRSGSRLYGILCVPKKDGHYPVVLKVPGAGVRAYRGDTALAEKGVITFEIGIHGIPVTLPNEVYYNLAFGPLYEYYFANINNRDQYYYKRVYAGCVRAVDFLLSLPQADSSRVAVYGGSQGGALAIVTAALHEKVRYVAALYPALSDLTGYLHGRAGGWPHVFSPSLHAAYENPDAIKTAGYYDVVNFARLLNVPGWYSWGYNDETCPPTTAYAVYNNIHAPKQLLVTKETGHWMSPLQAEEVSRWLLNVLQAGQ